MMTIDNTIQLLTVVNEILQLNICYIIEDEPDDLYGYLWFDTDDNAVHVVSCSLAEYIKKEKGEPGSEGRILFEIILQIIESSIDKTTKQSVSNKDCLVPVFEILHEIGHFEAYQNDPSGYISRGIAQKKQREELCRHAYEDFNNEQIRWFHLATSYRQLSLEKEADDFASANIQFVLNKLMEMSLYGK